MNWQQTYNDLDTKKKRKARQKIYSTCQLSKASFYNALNGKETRALISEKINQIIIDTKNQ